ncbi:S9 family peptidase [Catellatospora tritici]|uniref:S9 family peptidase n=1 Tax=Catellatospora tritici TaxID=2851566 RepID=UPI001C2D76C2|nr:prolyl oligopeptidase family serine peptidase [Catellatospora tritici]MBV1849060.1 prolyl oligopeptidase family serine peptidase [Catellatospora tritici]
MGEQQVRPGTGRHTIAVSSDGLRVGHLHHGVLRLCELPAGRVTTLATGVDTFAFDRTGATVVWISGGWLHHRQATGPVPTPGPVDQARPDPTGRRLAYLYDGAIRVAPIGPVAEGGDELLAGEPDGVRWGEADPHAAYFGRDTGWWWAPDGESIMATRRQGDQVSLHLLDLDGGWVDVHWDREIYPYLGAVRWADGGPLITVLRRSQGHGLILAVDRRTGETQVHAELADPRWVNPVDGTPRHLADGRVLVGGEISHDGYDARCLFADGTLLTPPTLYVRRVVGRLGPGSTGGELGDLLVEASEGEPAEQHLFRVRSSTSGGMVVHRLTSAPGWHSAECGGDTVVTGLRSLDDEDEQITVWHAGRQIVELTPRRAVPASLARPTLDRVTDRRLPTAVLYPPGHVFGRRLPVLLLLPDTPTAQQVRSDHAAFADARAWAEAGFAVVLVDGRGTVGVSPSFEKVTHRRVVDLAVGDQADALRLLADKHSDLDMTRVTAYGTGFGGWLAAVLAARRPDTVRAAIAVDPWDWSTLPVPLAERYLGPRELDSETYARHDLGELPDTVVTPPNEKEGHLLIALRIGRAPS